MVKKNYEDLLSLWVMFGVHTEESSDILVITMCSHLRGGVSVYRLGAGALAFPNCWFSSDSLLGLCSVRVYLHIPFSWNVFYIFPTFQLLLLPKKKMNSINDCSDF